MKTYQKFYMDGVLTEVSQQLKNSQHLNAFFIQQFRSLHGMADGWHPNNNKYGNMGWFRNVSKAKKEKALKIFKLLQLEQIA